MKKLIVSMIAIGMLSLLNAPALADEQQVRKITLSYEDLPNPPFYFGYSLKDTNPSHPGLFLEILDHISNTLNVEIEYKRLPWQRALAALKKGATDGVFSASFNQKRNIYAQYPHSDNQLDSSRALTEQTYFLYRQKGDYRVQWDGVSLRLPKGSAVGIKTGYSIGNELRQMGHMVLETPTTDKNLAKLNVGRLTAYADLEGMVEARMLSEPKLKANIEKVFPPLKRKPYFLIFGKDFYSKNKAFVEQVWNTIKDFKSSPEYARLRKEYQ